MILDFVLKTVAKCDFVLEIKTFFAFVACLG